MGSDTDSSRTLSAEPQDKSPDKVPPMDGVKSESRSANLSHDILRSHVQADATLDPITKGSDTDTTHTLSPELQPKSSSANQGMDGSSNQSHVISVNHPQPTPFDPKTTTTAIPESTTTLSTSRNRWQHRDARREEIRKNLEELKSIPPYAVQMERSREKLRLKQEQRAKEDEERYWREWGEMMDDIRAKKNERREREIKEMEEQEIFEDRVEKRREFLKTHAPTSDLCGYCLTDTRDVWIICQGEGPTCEGKWFHVRCTSHKLRPIRNFKFWCKACKPERCGPECYRCSNNKEHYWESTKGPLHKIPRYSRSKGYLDDEKAPEKQDQENDKAVDAEDSDIDEGISYDNSIEMGSIGTGKGSGSDGGIQSKEDRFDEGEHLGKNDLSDKGSRMSNASFKALMEQRKAAEAHERRLEEIQTLMHSAAMNNINPMEHCQTLLDSGELKREEVVIYAEKHKKLMEVWAAAEKRRWELIKGDLGPEGQKLRKELIDCIWKVPSWVPQDGKWFRDEDRIAWIERAVKPAIRAFQERNGYIEDDGVENPGAEIDGDFTMSDDEDTEQDGFEDDESEDDEQDGFEAYDEKNDCELDGFEYDGNEDA